MTKTKDELYETERQLNEQIQIQQQQIELATKNLARLERKGTSTTRSQRTHRLIQVGAELESMIGKEIDPIELKKTLAYKFKSGRSLADIIRHYLDLAETKSED